MHKKKTKNRACTRKTGLALEVKFYLDVHRVCMAMAMNADQLKWRQGRISAVPFTFLHSPLDSNLLAIRSFSYQHCKNTFIVAFAYLVTARLNAEEQGRFPLRSFHHGPVSPSKCHSLRRDNHKEWVPYVAGFVSVFTPQKSKRTRRTLIFKCNQIQGPGVRPEMNANVYAVVS